MDETVTTLPLTTKSPSSTIVGKKGNLRRIKAQPKEIVHIFQSKRRASAHHEGGLFGFAIGGPDSFDLPITGQATGLTSA
jgi:hypothetical protein